MSILLLPANLLLLGVLSASNSGEAVTAKASLDWTASWIWKARDRYDGYNDTIEARRSFDLPEFASATLRVTADTYYRLFVNGEWVNDGPSRSWPDHYQYDVIDTTPYLKQGRNDIRIIAKFFGIGTFHQVPKEAGLLAQLDVFDSAGKPVACVGTDAQWEVRDAAGWTQYAPKQSVQLGPYEIFDARREDTGSFEPAVVRYPATHGPWKDLNPRDCPLLTRKPFAIKAFTGANVVRKPSTQSFILPTSEFAYDGVVFANNHNAMTGAYATVVELKKKGTLTVDADGNRIVVDGKEERGNSFELGAGRHFLLCALSQYFGHWRSDAVIRIHSDAPVLFWNPLTKDEEAVWCYAPLEGGRFQTSDMQWSLMKAEERDAINAKLNGLVQECIKQNGTLEDFKANLGKVARVVRAGEMTEDVHGEFERRAVVAGAIAPVDSPESVVTGQGEAVIHPAEGGDVELIYDLGEQNIGFWQFEVEAEAGAIIDLAGIEYITPKGKVQHTERYRNDMRYVCKRGESRFTSLMRRSGRYLFVTFRNLTEPAKLKGLRLIESTYPVQPIGGFECSDPRLTKIWEISARTLKLCMEDTYTDCPLYEQTLWVGDARNEAVFSYTAFGSADMGQRCAKLSAYSLDKYPLTLSQLPSTWEIILPAWSFLWGIMIWDNYYYSGDKDFLAWAYPYAVKNLKNAESYSDARGLFSAPFWNMFDWSGIDDGAATVTHNSMFAVGAADAAIKCGEALGDTEHLEWLRQYRERLVKSINALWDEKRGWYPDCVRDNGELSPKTCVHTGFLSLLYDICPPEKRADVLAKVIAPPEGMTGIGSPFAVMYLLDALEKEGRGDEVVRMILRDYQAMLDMNATTVWETFASGNVGHDGFPTRSHCHAWSSAPIHFLNRIVLGIVQDAPAGAAYRISPRLNGLEWAKGATASIRGPVEVSWKREGNILRVEAKGPEGTELRFERNDSMEGLKVEFNGKSQE